MFKGFNFVYDGIPSENFELKIGFDVASGSKDTYSGVAQTIEEDKVKRNPTPLFMGVEVTGKIVFDMLLYSESEIDTYDRQYIDEWLFKKEYKTFEMDQKDYYGLTFQSIITSGEKVEIGNVPYAKRVQVVCDNPYAYTDEYTYKNSSPDTFVIENLSNINDYSYPNFTITMNTGGTCTIVNNTESRTFEITGLSAGEVITVDNKRKKITSSLGTVLSKFNKKWFRLVPSDNSISLIGDFDLITTIKYNKTI